MRALWFIPHGITFTGPERSSGYPGGFASTLNPIGRRQAAAVAARGQHRARELVSLLEGAGYTAEDEGTENWNKTDLVGEGFNRFDKGSNGRVHSLTIWFSAPPGEFDELMQRFAALPSGIIIDARDESPRHGRRYVMWPKQRYGHDSSITLSQRKDSSQVSARLSLHSHAYFYRWAKRDAFWRILIHGSSENLEEQQRREQRRLGFYNQRPWPVHAAPPGGLRKSEAEERVRLYLIGAGVETDRMKFAGRRAADGWDITITGGPTAGLDGLHIGDDGRIRSREQ